MSTTTIQQMQATIDSLTVQRDAAEALARKRGGELELCWCVATESSPDDAPDPFPAGMAYKAVDAQQDREYAAIARAEKAEAERDEAVRQHDIRVVQSDAFLAMVMRVDTAERRESELGLQVVAQAARLRLADRVAKALRDHGEGRNEGEAQDALDAWDARWIL